MQKEYSNQDRVFERIQKEIDMYPVVLYMKGTSTSPQCGFSAMAVSILSQLNVEFKDVNILIDPFLRDCLKKFSNWPTFPQLYIKGELIGGCDIMQEMYNSGELASLFENKGVRHK